MGETAQIEPLPGSLTIAPATTFYPKITGKVEELIHNYKFRNSVFDPEKKEYLPGPPQDPLISLVGTVKLHGTHADFVIYADNTIRLQSRNQLSLQAERDNYDCAKILLPKKSIALKLRDQIVVTWKELNAGEELKKDAQVIIAGEWIGPGVQKSVAIEKLPSRAFVILSISVNGIWQPCEPYAGIHAEEEGIYNISRGGFFASTLDINNPEPGMELMNKLTLEVEAECPFGKSFAISGVGEGIVWRPVREDLRGYAKFWLKTKGPLHRISTTNKLPKNTGNMEQKEKARAFAEAAVGEMRLQQAWDWMGEMGITKDESGTTRFNGWLAKDVGVEEKMKIEELGVDKQVLKRAIADIGKKWYFAKLGVL